MNFTPKDVKQIKKDITQMKETLVDIEGLWLVLEQQQQQQQQQQAVEVSVGRIVHVRLSRDCAQRIGGNAQEGDIAPAVVVRVVRPDVVNVWILGDGSQAVWHTMLQQGWGIGQWDWPERKRGT